MKALEKMQDIVLRKRALQEIVTLKEQQILGQLSAISRLEMENLDKFWLESNSNSFLPIVFGCKRALQEIITFKEQQI